MESRDKAGGSMEGILRSKGQCKRKGRWRRHWCHMLLSCDCFGDCLRHSHRAVVTLVAREDGNAGMLLALSPEIRASLDSLKGSMDM